MKILYAEQIKQADRYTVENEPIESVNLMERAAEVIAQWICTHIPQETSLAFFIGKGNNGGDALAVARMLYNVGYPCDIYTVFDKKMLSEECRYNLDRLPRGLKPKSLDKVVVYDHMVVIDALLGTGVKGTVTEPILGAIRLINSLDCRVVSIDMPSGMQTEYGNGAALDTIIRAETTLALEFPKLAMLLPEAGDYAGNIEILPIELSVEYTAQAVTPYYYMDDEFVFSLQRTRRKFAHKGEFGHALVVCGSEGMAGAAVLATGAALRSGVGLVTVHLPREERGTIHATNPSAIVSCDSDSCFSHLPADMSRYDVVGVGCGLGQSDRTVTALRELMQCDKPMVIDADALNLIAKYDELKQLIPAGSILTPHPGELKRLVGEWQDDAQRNEKARCWAAETASYLVVKGAHTMICTPSGEFYFNSTGNAGMAKGGSGDVLTGFITGLYARGYTPMEAAVIGTYLHGKAGEKAADYYGMEGMNAADLIDFLAEGAVE